MNYNIEIKPVVALFMRYLLMSWFVAASLAGYGTEPAGKAPPPVYEDLRGNFDEGGRTIDTVISPVKTMELSSWVTETSGLILWEGRLWTHNDDSDTRLYEIDTASGSLIRPHLLKGVENYDWEEIAQDGEFIYIGDFGNNGAGNRRDLHILRIEKPSLKSGDPAIDTIWFTYSDQVDFSPAGINNTEFDCEAFVVSPDSIYLFTKQWLTGNTTVYTMSKQPGKHTAVKGTSFQIGGLVTGATYLENKHLLVLCGYSGLIQPFVCLLYDYPDHRFFSGRKRRLNLSLLFHQVEGIATEDGLKYFISNEYSGMRSAGFVNVQKLHVLDLGPFLGGYLEGD